MIGSPITIEAARPPYVRFEVRAVIDRQATEAAGMPKHKDVNFALITPSGSRDVIEKFADEWLKDMTKKVADDLYPATWLQHFRAMYEEWKKGNEIPEIGTALRLWPGITPSELTECLQANVRTVEDLAQLNEEGMALIGMSGRNLKHKAKAYLEHANGPGKLAERISSLETGMETLNGQLAREREKNRELETELAKYTKKKAA